MLEAVVQDDVPGSQLPATREIKGNLPQLEQGKLPSYWPLPPAGHPGRRSPRRRCVHYHTHYHTHFDSYDREESRVSKTARDPTSFRWKWPRRHRRGHEGHPREASDGVHHPFRAATRDSSIAHNLDWAEDDTLSNNTARQGSSRQGRRERERRATSKYKAKFKRYPWVHPYFRAGQVAH